MNRFILWAALAFGLGLVARAADDATADKQPPIVKAAYVSAPSSGNEAQ